MNSQIGINIEHDVNIHMENRLESRHFFWFIWLMYAVVYMTKNCFNAALASIVAEGILTKSQTGFITSAFYLVYAPLQIVGGLAADRYSPERLVKIGLYGATIANVVIFFSFDEHAFLIKKGEKIRVDISSADNAHYVRHTNIKGLYSEQKNAKVANNTVYMQESCLILPIE